MVFRSQIEELDRLLAEIKSDELSKNVKNLKETQLELIKQFRAFQAEQNKVIFESILTEFNWKFLVME